MRCMRLGMAVWAQDLPRTTCTSKSESHMRHMRLGMAVWAQDLHVQPFTWHKTNQVVHVQVKVSLT